MKSHRLRGLAASVALAAAGAAHAATIDTFTGWNGVSAIGDFSPSVTQTYGQTITAAADDATLTSFTFHFNLTGGPAFPMRGKVYRWDPGTTRAIGAPLFDSAPVMLTGVGFQPYTFNIPGGVSVTPGQMYVMFVTVSQDLPLPAALSSIASSTGTGSYSGGQFVYQNNGANTTTWTGSAWNSLGVSPTRDAAFVAAFAAPAAPTPVPAMGPWALALLAMSVAAAGWKIRHP